MKRTPESLKRKKKVSKNYKHTYCDKMYSISFLEVWKKFLSSEMLGIYELKLGLHVINQARVKNHLLGNSCSWIKKTRLAWLQLALPEYVSYILHKSCKICFCTCLLICMIEETRRAREKWNTCLNKTLTFEKYC